MGEALILFLFAVIFAIIGIYNSNNQTKVNNKVMEIKNFNFLHACETFFQKEILDLCGENVFMCVNITKDIKDRKLSKERIEILIKSEILKKDDDIRLFNDEEIYDTISKCQLMTLLCEMREQQINKENINKVVDGWAKAISLIIILENTYLTESLDVYDTVMELFSKEKNPTLEFCDIIQNRITKIMNTAKDDFGKELIDIKKKYLSFNEIITK